MTSPRAVFDEDHEVFRAFRESVSRFLATDAVDRYQEWEKEGSVPASFYETAAEYGFLALAVPESAGGAGVDDARFPAVVLEEAMAAGLPAVALALAAHDAFALPLLVQHGAPERVEPLLPDLAAGRLLLAVVDADDASAMVQAEPRDGGWTLHGTAETVVNGQGAGLFLVVARVDAPPGAGADLVFAVDAAAPGLHRAPAEPLLGLDACDVANLRFEAAVVTPADRIGGDSAGAALDQARAAHQRALAVAAVAGARTALRTTVEYVRVRKAFGRPIASFENTRHVLGGLGARIAAVETFVASALAQQIDAGTAAAAKLCATELLADAVDAGVQLHGGYGYMWEYPIARAYAAARFFRLHGGAGDHLDSVLADAIGL